MAKVSKAPNRFFPDRALATEDVNRDLSHTSNMIKNDQDARFVYTSFRIPCAITSTLQKKGVRPEAGRPVFGSDNTKYAMPNNQEAIRTFAFVPPFDMHLVSTDFYVKGACDDIDLTENDPMVAKVKWIVEDGGEGFPPRPPSILPEGMAPSGDPAITKEHTQITISITEEKGFFTRTDNGEYTLRGGKCYRVMVSDPDVPTRSSDPDFVYDQAGFWRYSMAWIQVNLKYDKWQFDRINRPDVKFYNGSDSVEKNNAENTGLEDQVDSLAASTGETTSRRRYPKAELHYFGIGNFNGVWARPESANTKVGVAPNIYSKATRQSASGGVTYSDSYAKKVIPDFDSQYIDGTGNLFADAKLTNNFQKNVIWRSPMGPWVDEPEAGYVKWIWGYSVGLVHNVTYDWQTGMDIKDPNRHLGYNYYGTLGHGFYFDNNPNVYRNYITHRNNAINLIDGRSLPALRELNASDNGGLKVDPPTPLYRNDTNYGSTSIPDGQQAERRPGHASGFPGDYLSEIHSYQQYGNNPNVPEGASGMRLRTTTTNEVFDAPESVIPTIPFAGLTAGQDLNRDLYTIFTTVSETNQLPQLPVNDRNFQKVYVLLWVL